MNTMDLMKRLYNRNNNYFALPIDISSALLSVTFLLTPFLIFLTFRSTSITAPQGVVICLSTSSFLAMILFHTKSNYLP